MTSSASLRHLAAQHSRNRSCPRTPGSRTNGLNVLRIHRDSGDLPHTRSGTVTGPPDRGRSPVTPGRPHGRHRPWRWSAAGHDDAQPGDGRHRPHSLAAAGAGRLAQAGAGLPARPGAQASGQPPPAIRGRLRPRGPYPSGSRRDLHARHRLHQVHVLTGILERKPGRHAGLAHPGSGARSGGGRFVVWPVPLRCRCVSGGRSLPWRAEVRSLWPVGRVLSVAGLSFSWMSGGMCAGGAWQCRGRGGVGGVVRAGAGVVPPAVAALWRGCGP